MSKLLKSVAPVILVVFCSVCIIGPAWGEGGITAPKISAPDYIDAGKSLPIKVVFDKDTYSEGNYALQIVFPNSFGQSNIGFQITKEAYELSATAPMQEGRYVIEFRVNDPQGVAKWTVSSEVKVLGSREAAPITFGGVFWGLIGGIGDFFQRIGTAGWYGGW